MRVRPPRLLWLLTLLVPLTVPAGAAGSSLEVKDLCAPVPAGLARCQAVGLALRATGSLVHPRVRASRATRVQAPSARNRPAAAAVQPAVGPPDPGSPAYLRQAYDLSYLSQTGGSGDTVAVVDAYDDPTAESDLAVYRDTYGLGDCTTANGCFRKVNQTGASSPLPAGDDGWATEISLDLDAVSALCPRCKILLVEADSESPTDMQAAVAKAAALGAKQISNSWSVSSKSVLTGPYTFAGVATVAATGDEGYVGSGYSNYPAAFAAVTAAGGTSLAAGDGTSPRGFAESAWSLAGDGSAAGSGCNLRVTKPAYQHDTGCTGRAYADVSADADPGTGLTVYDSGQGGWVLVGGTSLASPLIAAFYAVTGLNATTPAWAYASSALLNDPLSGTNGSCTPTLFYICNAVSGFDGPTGVGSISGDVVAGAPGIGGPGSSDSYAVSVGPASATLHGGVYPNKLDTTYWWEYGTGTDYGRSSPAAGIGTGPQAVAVSADLSGLAAGTTYHYRLVARNALGTSYGYDYSFTTTSGTPSTGVGGTQPVTNIAALLVPPASVRAPSIVGTPRRRVTLGASFGSWSPSPSSYSVQWQRGRGSSYVDIAGATGTSYTPVKADEHSSLRVVVTARNAYGATRATSAAVGPVAWNPPVRGGTPVITGTARVGAVLGYRAPAWKATTKDTRFSLQWKRCGRDGRGCRAIRGARRARYRLTRADAGHRIVLSVTATNPDASVAVISRASAVVVVSLRTGRLAG